VLYRSIERERLYVLGPGGPFRTLSQAGMSNHVPNPVESHPKNAAVSCRSVKGSSDIRDLKSTEEVELEESIERY
jgi:hypothetical protein